MSLILSPSIKQSFMFLPAKTVPHRFIEIVKESSGKLMKLWVDHGGELYNNSMQKWLDNNNIIKSSTHNEGKSVVAEIFTKTLKGKIYLKSHSKYYLNYLDKLVDNDYNNTYHVSISKKSVDADYSALTEEIKLSNKTPKFEVVDRIRITKYRNIFMKRYIKKEKYLWLILCWKIIHGHIKSNIWMEKK